MAELAAGAVHSLLGLIRNEALLLDSVRTDVQFIKEEMESMNSFLMHLARTAPPGGEHDEQVRTWMKQVRDLAHDCSNCIDLYLRRGDPEIHRARGLRGYTLWVVWFVQKIVAQHRAAAQLRELKNRARDVGERRLRYGVEVPAKAAVGQASGPGATTPSSSQSKPARGRDEEDDHNEPATRTDDPDRRALAFSETRILEDCTEKLVKWLKVDAFQLKLPSIAIAAEDIEDARDIAREALATDFESKVINIEVPSFQRRQQDPLFILICILRKLLSQDQGEDAQWSLILGLWKHAQEYYRNRIIAKIEEIEDNIKKHLQGKMAEIEETEDNIEKHLEGKRSTASADPLEPLGMFLLQQLLPPKPEQRHDKSVKKATGKALEEGMTVEEIATKLQEHMEAGESETPPIALDHAQYVHILREVFPPKPKEQEDTTTDQIEQKLEKIKQDILQKMHPKPQEDKLAEEATEIKVIEQTITKKIGEIRWKIREQLSIKVFVDKIKECLSLDRSHRTLIILQHLNFASGWKEIRHALGLLRCADGSAVIVTTNSTEEAKEFCYPEREPIICSLVGVYHDKVLQLTNQQMKDDHPEIFRGILEKCEPHEFCMQIFARALYANPNRSLQELQKLQDTLVRQGPLRRNARRMFKFSYNELPREYKVCLLYLAIFPRGHNIKRSTLIGRWVAEGLINKEDWPGSVRQAEQCFDELIDRCLVYPGDIGAAGKVKSCMVHNLVHEFISKIAKKEHLVDTRLSHHLARHFSVGSDVRLRSSDNIEKFLQKLYRIPQLPLVKVLDLEGCRYFEKNQHYLKSIFKKNQHYLKNICNKMLLLKYLSLRNTDITKLPKEINNLHQLEVLDIRQTKVRAHATKHVLLLKLKRLLASPISTDTGTVRAKESFSSVQIPSRIEKMTNMEVLSHVKASRAGHGLKDIGKLWQLRKLGVVIKDKNDHLGNLLQAISDLNECLQSLSITLPRSEGTPSSVDLQREIRDRLRSPPKVLESLSISGTTHSWQLLTLLAKGRGKLSKLTLSCTHLNQDHLKELGQLPKLQSFRLRHESYIDSNLTFKKEEFQNLKYFIVEGSNMTEISFEDGATPNLEKIVLSSTNMNSISFEDGAAPKLEKIVLSSTNIKSLCGVDSLPVLEEVELNGNRSPLSLFDKANRVANVTLRDTLLKQGDLQILAKKPNMRCLMLLDKSCEESQLTFNKDEFPKVSLLVVKCDGITNISFSDRAAPKLEKIVWSFTSMESLSGINNLRKLKELEFNGQIVPDEVIKAIKAHPKRPVLKHNIPQNED